MIRLFRRASALLCLGVLTSCGAPAPLSRLAVVGRVGGVDSVAAQPAQSAVSLKLGSRKRAAIRPAAGSAFEVAVPARARRLSFSLAFEKESGASARFEIRDGERPLFVETLSARDTGWHDRSVDLADARTLRFEIAGASGAADALWGSIAFLGDPPADGPTDPPNIVLVSLDTLGAAYLGSFEGVRDVSPCIDAFFAEGFAFRRAYAQYGNTLVSHASLFTGLYPLHHRLYPGSPVVDLDSLVTLLAGRGYLTAALTEGGFVSSAFGFARGFDEYDDGRRPIGDSVMGDARETFARAGAWLEARARDARFFLFVHTYEVHSPYLPRDPHSWRIVEALNPNDLRHISRERQRTWIGEHNSDQRTLSEEDLRQLRALHVAEVHELDRELGTFLERLDALGLADETLVVVTADHGDQFGEHGKVAHGESLHNRVLHVPLAFRWPGHIRQGASDIPVQLVDVMPTVLELAGIEAPPQLDGRSLAPLLRGESLAPGPRAAFTELRSARGECLRMEAEPGCRLDRYAVQTRRFKLITSELPPYRRLYDLESDPLETRDVAADHPPELERHLELLSSYRAGESAGGPNLEGGLPPAPDAATAEQLEALGYLD